MKISELKGKHDHALTSWLKVIIFSLLMIAPLFASISQWVYVSVNKNAKDSYGTTEFVEKTSVYNAPTTMVQDETYTLRLNNEINENVSFIYYKDININWLDYNVPVHEYNGFCLYGDSYPLTYLLAYGEISEGRYEFTGLQTNTINTFTFTYDQASHDRTFNGYELINYQYVKSTLDNAFYYGVEKMTQSDLFNWTQNTTLYTGIKTMTDNLEIQTPAIAILLTYWFILTIIYVIIDIVLKGFTTLTHLIMGAKKLLQILYIY